jgi:hypothetical protein
MLRIQRNLQRRRIFDKVVDVGQGSVAKNYLTWKKLSLGIKGCNPHWSIILVDESFLHLEIIHRLECVERAALSLLGRGWRPFMNPFAIRRSFSPLIFNSHLAIEHARICQRVESNDKTTVSNLTHPQGSSVVVSTSMHLH